MSHEPINRASLEMGRRVAERLRRDPGLLTLARANLERWASRNHDAPGLLRCYGEWDAVLLRPIEGICAVLAGEDDESMRLRTNSPFAGVLSPQEVWEIKRKARGDQGAA